MRLSRCSVYQPFLVQRQMGEDDALVAPTTTTTTTLTVLRKRFRRSVNVAEMCRMRLRFVGKSARDLRAYKANCRLLPVLCPVSNAVQQAAAVHAAVAGQPRRSPALPVSYEVQLDVPSDSTKMPVVRALLSLC